MPRHACIRQALLRPALLLVLAITPRILTPADEPPTLPPAAANASALKLMQRYCFDCHGEATQEAGLRFDTLDLAADNSSSADMLDRILNVISVEKRMPPEDAELPTAQERTELVASIESELLRRADAVRGDGRWTRNRRLTTSEYNLTMQSLFAVDAEFSDMLPADPIAESGYGNDSERLGLSSLQIEAYLDSARRAVERYVRLSTFEQEPVRYQIEFEELFYSTADRYGTRARAPQPIDAETFAVRRRANLDTAPCYVDPLGPKLPGAYSDDEMLRAAIPKLNQQYVAYPLRLAIGELIVRVRAAGTADRSGRYPIMRVEAGITLGDGCSINKRNLGEVEVTASLEEPETYVFRMRLEDVPTKGPLTDEDSFDRLSVFDMDQVFISNITSDDHALFNLGRGGYSDPATGSKRISADLKQMAEADVCFLHLDCLEIEMLPGVGVQNLPYRWQRSSELAPREGPAELAVAREMLEPFMRHALRRPITTGEVDHKLALLTALREQGHSFEASLRETLVAVLVSPSFLFLESEPPADDGQANEPVTPYQLASRLSYLLWLSPADETLARCADDASIIQPEVLRHEAERLLADPRSDRFLDEFCRQWLRLDRHDNVVVSRTTYPTWDRDLASDSIAETLAYFREVFRSDSNALDLIDSDYAILNDRLGKHYGIEDVRQGSLHRVQLPKDSVRGGLLTQASVLTMNSDGTDSHPIRRGVWLLSRILGSPPPPPPPNVPGLDETGPELGDTSLKQRIERHRQPGGCQACHQQIDPWGLAMENFDATGSWRETVTGGHSGQQPSQRVDSAVQLPGGQNIQGIVELKSYIRQQRAEQFANALTEQLLTYVLGRPLDFADRWHVRQIQQRFASSEYRLRELVLAIVESELFQQPD